MMLSIRIIFCLLFFWIGLSAQSKEDSLFIKNNYRKEETYIKMRDGKKLFTTIYAPKDQENSYPIMLMRTPYSLAPYGVQNMKVPIGPNMDFARDGFIFVYQDVRGKYKSEGDFIANRPVNTSKKKKVADESTDTYDTIDWLIKNIKSNKKVGIWGISSPGMYASLALINSHPNLKAVSPQAPVTDWFLGDDRHHNGALMLMGSFSFLSSFGKLRDSISTRHPGGFSDYGHMDSYNFYLKTGALKNFNAKYLHNKSVLWNEMMDNPDYNDYWEARNYLKHIKKIAPAVLVVGGWFDQEDLYGPLKTYAHLARLKSSGSTHLVMGPWFHGSWTRGLGDSLNDVNFSQATAKQFREDMELPFFKKYLKGTQTDNLPAAKIFFTGSNQWASFQQWPSAAVKPQSLYLNQGNKLSFDRPDSSQITFDAYISDPNKPVPYTNEKTVFRGYKYMFEDQYFAAKRPDVLVYESDVLTQDVKIGGNLQAELYISTTGTDADFIVKLIDLHPYNSKSAMADYQLLVRGEVMRAKFRDSFSKPKALKPNTVTKLRFDMQDAAHVFKKGHKIMVQIQSTWFPLVDRNPQQFLNINEANDNDFLKQEHRIYFSKEYPSQIILPIIKSDEN
ncbi:CocE/NonD family hydrolase [Pedobacter heparinus]|uniref:Peptidase S15 n=1 Tax=Pedobacter heparinus (strain ATCC 13125 / DSM 2366 / CIP 104194 / JCM 7457 / NBRC 12017 / NCIMB 9290 / NRRL B-14731 / HIM 762-3) TaxID=485917 RepID=C6XU09_PEDHD|nr:CocE/NonD family hydrolase [Pedobacter heparinus]ACU03795.1 peptidase S15 [Pedobacter heparinus DSM 2366]